LGRQTYPKKIAQAITATVGKGKTVLGGKVTRWGEKGRRQKRSGNLT